MKHLLISYHTGPSESPGQDLAGGMNVLLDGFLAHTRHPTEVVTRSFGEYQRLELHPGIVLHRIPCGADRPWTREKAERALPEFERKLREFVDLNSVDLVTAHYWLSGLLLKQFSQPCGLMFHTLQKQKGVPRTEQEKLRAQAEGELIDRYPCAFLHWQDLHYARSFYPRLRGTVLRPGSAHSDPSSERSPGRPRTFGWAARRDDIKNFSLAQEIFRKLRRKDPEVKLRVAGMEGENQDGLVFLGSLPSQEMPSFYRSIDQLWNFSHYETFGLSILEALSFGCSLGLQPNCHWARRLQRLGLSSEPGRAWTPTEKATAKKLAAAFTWERSIARWDRWLESL